MPQIVGAEPAPAGVTPDFEHPQDVLYTINLVSQILSVSLVTPFVLLRLYAKAYITPPFLIEDYACVVAWFLSVGYSSTAFMMYHFGGGHHVWELSPQNFEGFLKALYADTVVYGPNAYFTKLALLLVIARVFREFRKTWITTYILIGAMAGYYLPVMILKAAICRPIAGYWDSNIPAQCFDQRAIFVADTVVSAVTDTAVLVIPIPAVMALRMPLKDKMRVWTMLGLGGIATAASIIRMFVVIRLKKSEDETVDFVKFNLLGTAEVSIGLICACLPAINIIVQKLEGHLMLSGSSSSRSRSFRMKSLKFLRGSNLETAPPLTNPTNVGTFTGVTGSTVVARDDEFNDLESGNRRHSEDVRGDDMPSPHIPEARLRWDRQQ